MGRSRKFQIRCWTRCTYQGNANSWSGDGSIRHARQIYSSQVEESPQFQIDGRWRIIILSSDGGWLLWWWRGLVIRIIFPGWGSELSGEIRRNPTDHDPDIISSPPSLKKIGANLFCDRNFFPPFPLLYLLYYDFCPEKIPLWPKKISSLYAQIQISTMMID